MRIFWLCLGMGAIALGAVGAVLPLLPTTPLALLGAWCFARSSPRLHGWLLAHPRLGPPIAAWRDEGAVSRRGKLAAMAAIAASFAISLAAGVGAGVLAVQAAVLGAVAVFLLTRPAPGGRAAQESHTGVRSPAAKRRNTAG
ncbi:DUF454 domain-containing protein [Rhodobacteraceae bacterium WD3A24]|nr:DUF454 domain-containing protein [Rhodobacteraceae bacterium WD3A24]